MRYFERILKCLEFDFIPIFSIDNDELLGHKIIKNFSYVGFNDKELMYQLAYDEGVFSSFTLQLLEKAFKQIHAKKLDCNYIFYTLRMNFIDDPFNFFNSLNKIIEDLKLNKDRIVFDIKGIDNWTEFHERFSNHFKYKLILKEDKNTNFTSKSIFNSKATFIEPRSIDTLAFIRNNPLVNTPLIFNLRYEESINHNILKSLGVKYYYNY